MYKSVAFPNKTKFLQTDRFGMLKRNLLKLSLVVVLLLVLHSPHAGRSPRELPNVRQLGVVHESEMKKSAKLPRCNLRLVSIGFADAKHRHIASFVHIFANVFDRFYGVTVLNIAVGCEHFRQK